MKYPDNNETTDHWIDEKIKNLSKTYRVYQKQEGLIASIRGLFHREYREVHAVKDINLTVEEGEFVAFLGPNGAGKTTTLKLLSGVINPDQGSVQVLGHTPWERENEYRRKFALVMGQKNQLCKPLNFILFLNCFIYFLKIKTVAVETQEAQQSWKWALMIHGTK